MTASLHIMIPQTNQPLFNPVSIVNDSMPEELHDPTNQASFPTPPRCIHYPILTTKMTTQRPLPYSSTFPEKASRYQTFLLLHGFPRGDVNSSLRRLRKVPRTISAKSQDLRHLPHGACPRHIVIIVNSNKSAQTNKHLPTWFSSARRAQTRGVRKACRRVACGES